MIDKIVEETLKDSPLKAYFENEPYKSVDIYEDTKDRIHHALTQFAEIIKSRIEKLPVYMKVAGGDLKQYKEAVLLDDILAILPDNGYRDKIYEIQSKKS
jgi:hypothetical protein